MSLLEAKSQVAGLVAKACGADVGVGDIEFSQHADLSSNVCFKLAKEHGRKPAEVAEEIAGKIKPSGLIKQVEAANGFLNFFIDYSSFGRKVLGDSIKAGYGRGSDKKTKIVLEHTSVNPSGPVHVGRLRNSIIGDSLRRILLFAGYPVTTLYWVDDVGKQIAMIALAGKMGLGFDDEVAKKYARYPDKEDYKIFSAYVAANKRFEEDEGFRKNVQALIHDAETGSKQAMADIKAAAAQCLTGQKKTYDRLGFVFDRFDYESEEIESERVFKVLDKLKKTQYWIEKEGVGAGLDLSPFGIEKRSGLSVCERSDGTTVYLARDISYHLRKLKEGDTLINVLGEDHKLEFDELSTILREILNVSTPVEVVHFSFVNFAGKKLSTRRGEIAPVDVLLDEAVSKAEAEIEKRGIAEKKVAPQIGVGAVKYHLIKTAPNKPITFRWGEALSFDGDAAPYIQYAHARALRILEKGGEDVSGIDVGGLKCTGLSDEEENLIKMLSLFPLKVEEAAGRRTPHIVAEYAYQLASAFSQFYYSCPVLASEEPVRSRRLLTVDAAKKTIASALDLLGVEAPERM